MNRVVGGEDIAVRHHGDRDGGGHVADNIPIRPPGVHLRPGAPVYGERGSAGALTDAGKFDGVDMAAVKALAEFDRDGAAGGLGSRRS